MKFFYTASVLLLGGLLAGAGEVEDLIAELDSGDKVNRREAARSLALLGPDAKAAVPALVRGSTMTRNRSFRVRNRACEMDPPPASHPGTN